MVKSRSSLLSVKVVSLDVDLGIFDSGILVLPALCSRQMTSHAKIAS